MPVRCVTDGLPHRIQNQNKLGWTCKSVPAPDRIHRVRERENICGGPAVDQNLSAIQGFYTQTAAYSEIAGPGQPGDEYWIASVRREFCKEPSLIPLGRQR